MIVSFIHNKKKKQVKIDELESIFSIKNKINYIFFSESKKIEDIEVSSLLAQPEQDVDVDNNSLLGRN